MFEEDIKKLDDRFLKYLRKLCDEELNKRAKELTPSEINKIINKI